MPGILLVPRVRAGAVERDLFPLLRLEQVAPAHREVAVANAGVGRVALGGGARELDVGARVVEPSEHQVAVREPVERVKVFAAFGQVEALVDRHGSVVGLHVRGDDVGPKPELHEDVRRHVQRVRRGRCDVGVGTSGYQAERRMIGVVERVDDEVRRAGVRGFSANTLPAIEAASAWRRKPVSPGRTVPSSDSAYQVEIS